MKYEILTENGEKIADANLVSYSGGITVPPPQRVADGVAEAPARTPMVLHLICPAFAIVADGDYQLCAFDEAPVPVRVVFTGRTAAGTMLDATLLGDAGSA